MSATTTEKLKTTSVGIRELKPCVLCNGPIAPIFYSIEIKHAVIAQGSRDFVGLSAMGFSPGIAECFMSAPAAEILENGVRKLFVCNRCFMDLPTKLLVAWEAAGNDQR